MGGWKKVREPAGSGIRVKGDERVLGDSDFVLDVLDASTGRFERKSQLRSQGVILSWVSERVSGVPGVYPDCIYRPGKYPRKRQGPESVLLLGRTGAWDACDLSCKDAGSDPARSEHLRETGANDCR